MSARQKENGPRQRAATSTTAQESKSEPDESQVNEFAPLKAAADTDEIYTPHPLTTIIPPMSAKDREALQADMLKRGLSVPILRHGNLILDGINRYEICRKFGIKLDFEDYNGEREGEDKDILAEIVSRNVPRRHLSTKQRAAIAAELANMRQGERTDLEPSLKSSKVSESEAAKLLNVSRSSVQAAKRKKREAKAAAPAEPPKNKAKKETPFEDQVYKKWAAFINRFPREELQWAKETIREYLPALLDDEMWKVWTRARQFIKKWPPDEHSRIEKLIDGWCRKPRRSRKRRASKP